MQESALILSEYEEINSCLLKPIVATQRIKYTCINVSTNHVVLGSTSGSIYLFTREPCVFQQLIPLSEGPVTHILISPDEKTVALSSKRGSVCVVNIKPSAKLLSISNEHLGETITCLCWNSKSSEIYVGDNNGKISTIVLSIFTVNGMFQAPSCALMHLDSSIVQMDYCSHYLLVSTLTRCYICDTAQEQFKHIGNKARDGEFGGCFLKTCTEFDKKPSNCNNDKGLGRSVGLNSLIGLNDDTINEQNLKIYCSRPGCRLWEVNTQGIVGKTHQFKEALSIAPSYIFKASLNKSHHNINNGHNNTTSTTATTAKTSSSTQTLNFSRLFVISKKYLLSYTTSYLYIIDPVNTNIILWTDEFTNIYMVNVIEDKIYLMTVLGQFHCLLLSTIESLILKLYDCKLYIDCLQACTTFQSQLLKVITDNEVLLNVDDKLNNIDLNNIHNNDIINTLQPILSAIQHNINNTPQRLNSGIVVVNTGTGKLHCDENIRTLNSPVTNSIVNPNSYIKNGQHYDSSGNNDKLTANTEVAGENVIKQSKNLKKDMTISQRENNENDMKKITHSLSQVELSDPSKVERNLSNNKINNNNSNNNSNNSCQSSESSKEIQMATIDIQTTLEPLYILIGSLKSSVTADEVKEIIGIVTKTMRDINNKYKNIAQLKYFIYEIVRSFERHYFCALLEIISIDLLSTKDDNNTIINETIKSFADLNTSNYSECTCGYPRVYEKCKEPKFLKVGRTLLEILIKIDKDKCILLCKNVPYMWREYLLIYVNDQNLLYDDNIIPLCLQTRDNIILSLLFRSLNDKQWGLVVDCINKMKMSRCLFCNQTFEILNTNRNNNSNSNNDLIDWSGITHEIMKKDGLNVAITFLHRLESALPHIKLKQDLYQSLIFTKLLDRYGLDHTVEFGENKLDSEYGSICSAETQKILMEALEKDLERPIKKTIFGTGVHHWGMLYKTKLSSTSSSSSSSSSICSSCTLSLQTPVLLGNNGISIFPCGHAYHVNCLIQKKITKCFLHS